jgi:TPP-dependent pyruvate/acetoin dehydrogenase alpha subunit
VTTLPDLSLAEAVLRIRIGQMLINEEIRAKAFRIPVHLALGHEAIAAAVSAAMAQGDGLCLTHRNIHYNIARASSLKAEMDELLLKESGIGGGRYGSMNMANPAAGVLYTSSILGNDLCVAAGVALAERVAGTGAVTFMVTGDGAMEEGAFYESLEFLKSASTSAVVIVENNDWSMFTRIPERRHPIDLSLLSSSFGIPYTSLTGNDPWHYLEELRRLRVLAASESIPVVVEVSLSTLGDYRAPSDGRHINYHSGLASPVSLSEWPLIHCHAGDPVHVIAEKIGEIETRAAALRVHATLLKEMES